MVVCSTSRDFPQFRQEGRLPKSPAVVSTRVWGVFVLPAVEGPWGRLFFQNLCSVSCFLGHCGWIKEQNCTGR